MDKTCARCDAIVRRIGDLCNACIADDMGEDPFDCWQCHGDGYTYDCFEEWACVDPEGGCDLCMSRCDVCHSHTPKEPPHAG